MADTAGPKGAGNDGNRMFILTVVGVVVAGLAAVSVVATRGGDDEPSADTGSDTEAAAQTDAETDADPDDAAEPEVADGGTADRATPDGFDDGAETAPVMVDGDPIASMERGSPVVQDEGEGAVGTVAPTLSGSGFDGSEIVIEADGRPKVVYFLAHWCPHCQREVPAVVELIDAGKKPDGLDIYAVSTAVDDGAPNFPPSDWLEGEGVGFPVMRDSDDATALTAYGPSGFPYAVYLDGENRVVAQSAGELEAATIEQLWAKAAAAG